MQAFHGAKRWALFAIAVALLTVGALVRPSKVRGPRHAFEMCIARPPERPATGPDVWSEALLASIARALSAEERADLEQALSLAATRWEARANPLLDDIEGEDPDASLEAWMQRAPSFMRIARAATRVRACAPDGFCVTPKRDDAPCPAGWHPAAPADEERARFLLWSWGHALRLRLASKNEARATAERIRTRIRSSQTIGLVLAADDEQVTSVDPYGTLRELWRSYGKYRTIARGESRDSTSTAPAATRDDEIIVLPKLIVVSERDAFIAEVLSP